MAVNDLQCELLPWDSEFFGVRIGRMVTREMDERRFEAVDSWRRAERLDCIYSLVDADDRTSIRTAETNGFQLVDLRVDLRRPGNAAPPPTRAAGDSLVRPAADADLPVLKRIAREAHRDSRFYFDDRFDPRRADDLFETWIEKSCRGWADRTLVLDLDGAAAGYVTCHREDDRGKIGLFAIAENARGRGNAGVLLAAALDALRDDGAGDIRVTTQGRNAAAQRAYQRAGFVTESVRLWYHWWPARTPTGKGTE